MLLSSSPSLLLFWLWGLEVGKKFFLFLSVFGGTDIMHISDRGVGFLHLFIIKKIKKYLLFFFLFFLAGRGKEKRKEKKRLASLPQV